MTLTPEYAQLTNRVYNRTRANRTPIPLGWTELRWIPDQLSGFSAGVYKKGDEIVIAFTGTNEAKVADFLLANIPIGLGLPSAQVTEAMLLYLQVKEQYPTAAINFTGHSLGGGLASVMAVFFDKNATVFDAAPFELGARNLATLGLYQLELLRRGYSDADFNAYTGSIDFAEFNRREANVSGFSVEGEALGFIRSGLTVIQGSELVERIGQQTLLDRSLLGEVDARISLHSMTLLGSMLTSLNFANAIRQNRYALELIFDDKLYRKNPETSSQANFLDRLYISQSSDASTALLDSFATDLQRINSLSGVSSQTEILKSLTALTIEAYYYMQSGFTKEFFEEINGGLKFDFRDIALDGANSLALPRLINASRDLLSGYGDSTYLWNLRFKDQWYLQAGDAAMTAVSETDGADIMIGGTGNDNLDGGGEDDDLYGGDGEDTLKGGWGRDHLIGGEKHDILEGGSGDDYLSGGEGADDLKGGTGRDTYIIDGNDTINDDDGNGVIKDKDGHVINGFFIKTGDDQYVWGNDSAVTATKSGSTFTVTLLDGSTAIIENFSSGNLGIVVRDDPIDQPTVLEILGDMVPEDQDLDAPGDQLGRDQNLTVLGHAGDWEDVQLVGSEGNDHILAGNLNDWVRGLGGADHIEMGSGDDVAAGMEGDDIMEGNEGRDILDGYEGNDRIYADDKVEITDAIESGTTGSGSGSNGGWITGGDGDDILVGNSDNEILSGGAGTDLLIAGQGDDIILGDADYIATIWSSGVDRGYKDSRGDPINMLQIDAKTFDWSYTENQTERIINNVWEGIADPAGAANDVAYAGAGNDWVRMGRGDDVVYGEDGDDDIAGEQGHDTLMGGAGNDTISGDASYLAGAEHGNDYLSGGAGDDELAGEGGSDIIFGDDGDDTIVGDNDPSILPESEHGDDYLDGGAGNDTIYAGGGNDTVLGGDDNDQLGGGTGEDMLFGDNGDDLMVGDEGNDYLDGGLGADQLGGGDGNDILSGGEGSDQMAGDDGNDVLYGEAGDDHMDAGAGDDTVLGGAGDDEMGGREGSDTLDGGDGNDLITGDAGNDALLGGAGTDRLSGGDGDDAVDGGNGDDEVQGNAGNDSVFGGAGNDMVFGGDGADTLDGGDGDDELQGNDGDDWLYDSLGNNRLVGGAGNDVMLTGAGNDTLGGSDGDDVLDAGDGDDYLGGESGDDLLLAGGGNDTAYGGTGNDRLFGDQGNDALVGGVGDDLIEGGAGDDLLIGGAGNDIMAGGDGNNIYVIGYHDGVDIIRDTDANGKINTLRFVDGIQVKDIKLDLGSLLIRVGNSGDAVHIEGFNPDDPYSEHPITRFEFSDGTVLTYKQLIDLGFDRTGTPQDDTIIGTNTTDRIRGLAGNDTLIGRDGNDTLDGGAGADNLIGGTGDDVYIVDDAGDIVTEELDQGIDRIEASINYALRDNVENLMLSGVNAINGSGNDLDNQLTGNRATNVLEGGAGNDTIIGNGGNDTLIGGAGDDTLDANYSNGAILRGGDGDDLLWGSAGNDLMDGGTGADLMMGGAGDDSYVVDDSADRISEQLSRPLMIRTILPNGAIVDAAAPGSGGKDSVLASATYTLDKFIENLTLTGGAAINGAGNSAINRIEGNNAGNVLRAATVNGRADSYGVDVSPFRFTSGMEERIWDQLLFRAGQGEYTAEQLGASNTTIRLDPGAGDTLIGNGGDDELYGDLENDTLIGGQGNDLLYGHGGADTLIGGSGNDTYVVGGSYNFTEYYAGSTIVEYVGGQDNVLIEQQNEGIDTVISARDFTLGENFENLTLIDNTDAYESEDVARYGPSYAWNLGLTGAGNDVDNVITGNSHWNYLYGLAGNDTLIDDYGNDFLDGGEGADVMMGGADYDTYVVDNVGDRVIEYNSWFWSWPDLVLSSITYSLPDNVEYLTLTGADNLNGTGNELYNVIYGNDGNNVLRGLNGGDQIHGGAGNDFIDGGNEDGYLFGEDGNDTLIGGYSYDVLDGGAGDDLMIGGGGNDTYYVDSNSDVTDETTGDGYDAVYANLTHTLGAGLENLYLTGDQQINGTGNELDNYIEGNDANNTLMGQDGNDVLDGRGGGDEMRGGAGDDYYYVDSSADAVVEEADAGHDIIVSSVSQILSDNVEDLYLLGNFGDYGHVQSLTGIGNVLANQIVANDGDNQIDSLAGDDVVDGGAGNDTIIGGAGNDNLYGGSDAVFLDSRLINTEDSDYPMYEVRQMLASNADVIDGEVGDDTIDGGSGDDTLIGGEGNDVIYGGSDGEQVKLDWHQSDRSEEEPIPYTGITMSLSNDDYLDGGAGDDQLDGGSGNDQLYGGDGSDYLFGGYDDRLNASNNDYLDGGAGIDTLIGGTGNDTYIVDGETRVIATSTEPNDCHIGSGEDDPRPMVEIISDTVIENADEGYDIVYSSVSIALPDNVEEIHLVGAANLDINGSAQDNLLVGNDSNNRLDGGAGADQMQGGLGDDTYYVDSQADVVVEQAGEGVDTVRAYIDGYQLGDHLENLDLASGASTGFGNAQNNRIRGNAQDNTLFGGDGDDRITGAGGNDVLDGGAGNDMYFFGEGFGHDVVTDSAGENDVIRMNGETKATDLILTRSGDDLLLGIKGYSDTLTMAQWFNGQRIESIQFCDGTIIDAATMEQRATLYQPLINLAPEANDDFISVSEDSVVAASGNALTNDNDPEQASLSVTSIGSLVGQYGTLTLQSNGIYSYALNPDLAQSLAHGETRTESFIYTISDHNGLLPLSAMASVQVTIDGVNDAPVTQTDVASVQEDQQTVSGNVLANDHDVDSGTVLRVVASGLFAGQFGTLNLSADGSYRYVLNNDLASVQALREGETVPESFAYQVSDGIANTSATLVINVTGSNDAPIAQADSTQVVEDLQLNAAGNVLTNDHDVDQSAVLSVIDAGTQAGQYGSLSVTSDGAYQYALNNDAAAVQSLAAGQQVSDSFVYTVTDETGAARSATLTVNITGSNDAPTAMNDSGAVKEEVQQTITGNVLSNDQDIDQGALLQVAQAGSLQGQYGNLDLAVDGSYTYALNGASTSVQALAEGQLVQDVFTYATTDGNVATSATLSIIVTGSNDTPITQQDFTNVQEDVQIVASGNVLTNDSDIDTDTTLRVALPGAYIGTYGTLTIAASGDYSYVLDNARSDLQRLAAGQSLADNFSYAATDGIATTTATLNIKIAGSNDAPVATNDFAAVKEDQQLTASGNVLLNDRDIDTNNVLSVAQPGLLQGQYGQLNLAADGSYSYALNNSDPSVQALANGQVVQDVFAYAATDGTVATPATLTVNISGSNDAPVTQQDLATVQEDTQLQATGNVLANDRDVDAGSAMTVRNPGTLTGAYGTLTLGSDGAYTYALNNTLPSVQSLRGGQSVVERFNYLASDATLTTPGELQVNGLGQNDAPVASNDSATLSEDATLVATGNLLTNDRDVDQGTRLTLANPGTTNGTYGVLTMAADGSYRYALSNASSAVQSLAAGQTVSENFTYTVADDDVTALSAQAQLKLSITGVNDAPILVNPLADQTATVAKALSVQLPAASFTDIDQGDILSWGVKLSDGSALPSWLKFDPATRTLSGTPSTAASLQIQVTATDKVGASATDVFALNVTAATGNGGQQHGNEGVGNGEDPPPPGHDTNQNDGPGTSPGHPGNQGNGKPVKNGAAMIGGANLSNDELPKGRSTLVSTIDDEKTTPSNSSTAAKVTNVALPSADASSIPSTESDSKTRTSKDESTKKATYLDPWAVANALTDFHLGGKNPVLGGEMSSVTGNTSGMNALLAGQQTNALNPQLGAQANSLKGFQGLKEGFDRLAA